MAARIFQYQATVCCLLISVAASAQEVKPLLLPGEGRLSHVIFSPKMDKIAVRHWAEDSKIHVYHFPSLRYLGDLGVTNRPHITQFSPCGKYAALNANLEKDGAISVWDVTVKPPKKLKLLTQKKDYVDVQLGAVADIRFSTDSKKIVGLDAVSLHSWNWQESEQSTGEWALPGSGFFLTRDTLMGFRSGAGGCAEIRRFDGKELRKLRDADVRLIRSEPPFVTPDGKYAVLFSPKDRYTYVFNLEKPGSQVVDMMNDHWLPKEQPKEGEKGERYYFPASAMTPDRSVIILHYGAYESRRPVWQGVGFFPRTQAKAKEFGLDLAKQSHLFLPVPKHAVSNVDIVVSPDGRWLAFTELDLPPRIWEIETLSKALLADKSVVKK